MESPLKTHLKPAETKFRYSFVILENDCFQIINFPTKNKFNSTFKTRRSLFTIQQTFIC